MVTDILRLIDWRGVDTDGNVGEAATRVAQGIPVGRAATIELRNQHAVYAATW